jgi:hypothetical protein
MLPVAYVEEIRRAPNHVHEGSIASGPGAGMAECDNLPASAALKRLLPHRGPYT